MRKTLYIISYDGNGRSGYGPFRSAEFYCLNTSVPKVNNDTITYSVVKLNGETDFITVSMEHTIQTEP